MRESVGLELGQFGSDGGIGSEFANNRDSTIERLLFLARNCEYDLKLIEDRRQTSEEDCSEFFVFHGFLEKLELVCSLSAFVAP